VKTIVAQAVARQLRKVRGSLTQAEFAQLLGIKQQQYSRYESGRRIPPDDVLLKAARYAHIDVQNIVGQSFAGQPMAPDDARMVAERLHPLSPEVRIVSPQEVRERLERLERVENYIPIPLVADRAAAGDPLLIDEHDIEGYAVIYQSWLSEAGKYACVRLRGDSMWPVLGEGDIVCVNHARREPELLRGKIVAAAVEGEGVTIKYLNWDERSWILEPENRAHRPIYVPKGQDVVVGAVEWCWRRFK
jgi:SOS-response transcriptional repressor LexA/DNA-binding XRE family transcriptional regulator